MKKLYKSFRSYLKTKKDEFLFLSSIKKEIKNNNEIILIYQMGKVGSKSIEQSLRDLNLKIPIYHLHFLSPNRVRRKIIDQKEKNLEIDKSIKIAKILWKEITQNKITNKKWKIITLVREPISRNISAFFQGIEERFPNFYQDYYSGSLDIEKLIDEFLNKYPHDSTLLWLDEELKFVFDIDVFSCPFPRSKGYTTFHKDNIDVLLIRSENLNQCFQESFSEFLNIDDIFLNRQNIGSEKKYAEIYKKFRETITLSESYINRMYKSKYTKHFYSEKEITEFRKNW